MALDLLSIQEHKIKSGVQGKMFLIYGQPKVGKSTIAAQFPNPIMLATEPGYNLINGIKAAPVNSWLDMKNYVKQLKKDEVRQAFDTVIVDTIDLAWNLCEKFIKTQNDVEDVADMAWGKGFKKVREEFQDVINSLGQMGYTLVFISHSEKKDYQDSMGVSHSGITPTLDKRPKEIITGLVDVILFACQEMTDNGKTKPVAYLRGGQFGNTEIEAGSRYGEGLPQKIDFNYDELVKAIQNADEAMVSAGIEISSNNKTVLEESKDTEKKAKKRPFSETYKEIGVITEQLRQKVTAGDTELNYKAVEIIESYLGKGKKLNETTSAQQDIVEEVLVELKALI